MDDVQKLLDSQEGEFKHLIEENSKSIMRFVEESNNELYRKIEEKFKALRISAKKTIYEALAKD